MKKLIVSALVFLIAVQLNAASQDRVTSNINPSQLVRLLIPLKSQLKRAVDRGPVEFSKVLSGLTLTLAPTAAQQTQLESLLEAQRDPNSPEYQHWLTPEEFAARFGASDSDIAKITAWLTSQNLTISEVARGRTFVVVSGTAAAVAAAFDTSLHYFDFLGLNTSAIPSRRRFRRRSMASSQIFAAWTIFAQHPCTSR